MEIAKLALLLIIGTCGAFSKLDPGEVKTLKIIAQNIGKRDWDFNKDPCSGGGNWMKQIDDGKFIISDISCDCPLATCHIKDIKLMGQNLSGNLAPEFFKLNNLAYLDLSRNCLSGSIPPEWATMNLVQLTLMGNKLSGLFPLVLTKISTLEILHIEANQFKGPIPKEIERLINLRKLVLSSNDFTGNLPDQLFKLVHLEDLRISDTSFTGHIPDMLKNLKNITILHIQGTLLDGPIPPSISSLNLIDLRISDLRGSKSWNFPELSNMKSIKILILRNCLLKGKIPDYLGTLIYLTTLDLSFNNLIGEVPPSISRLGNLNYLFLKRNQLSGKLPKWILQLSETKVDASENNFTWNDYGEAKCGGGTLNLVESCTIFPNNTKSWEPCLKQDFSCTTGAKYTSVYINCGGEEVRNLGLYTFDGDQEVRGASTYYSSANWVLSSTGYFPDDKVKNDEYIKENYSAILVTNFSTPLQVLYRTARTSPLSLTYYGLCLYNGQYTVELHFAEIIFTSNGFASLGRRVFDIYIQEILVQKDFNIAKQAGGVATPIVKTFIAQVTTNTLKIHLFWSGRGTQGLPFRGNFGPLISAIAVYSNFKPKPARDTKPVIIASVSCVAILLVIVALSIYCAYGNCFHFQRNEPNFDIQTFTLEEIKVATRNFHPENIIGEGGFGCVYKGKLADGRLIAVKTLSRRAEQGMDDFLHEIQAISSLRQHPNIVQLYGFCVKGAHRLLVHEYVENNSLYRALFQERNLNLDWPTRRKIILHVARALDHIQQTTNMIHKDIKTSNVLLDRDMNAKLSDFGLAKLNRGGEQPDINSSISGTIGYMAPEYATRGYLTQDADLYSFGAMAVEVVTGKMIIDGSESMEEPNLLETARQLFERGNKLTQLIEPELLKIYNAEEASVVLDLAVMCVDWDPAKRPRMSLVIEAMAPMEQGESSSV